MKTLNQIPILVFFALFSYNQLFGQNSSDLFNDGKKQFELGNIEAAKKQFQNCINAFEGSAKLTTKAHVDQSFMYLGIIEFHLLNLEQSRKYMEKLVDRNSYSGYIFLKKYYEALEYYINMDYQKCIKLVNNIILYDVHLYNNDITAFAYSLSALCNEKMGNDSKALDDYATIVTKYKKVPSKGIAFSKLGEKEEAIKMMEEIIKKEDTYDNFYTLACIYALVKNKEKTIENLEKAFQLGLTSPYYVFIRDEIDDIRKSVEFQNLIQKYNIQMGPSVKEFYLKRENNDYKIATGIGNLESLKGFLNKYPESIWKAAVNDYITEMSEWKMLDKNSILHLEEYLTKYPKGIYSENALDIIETKNWEIAIKDTSINLIESYISSNSNGKFLNQATQIIDNYYWNRILKNNDTNCLEDYLIHCPLGTHRAMVQNRLIEKKRSEIVKDSNSVEVENFIKKHPDYDKINAAETLKDADGNEYKTVKIGNQEWMAENLRTTTYNDGTPIPYIRSSSEWSKLKTGAYCYYDNSESNISTCGMLYNWYAVSSGKLSPAGWRVPTNDDWTIMVNYLSVNGYNYDGSKGDNKVAKAVASTTGWVLNEYSGGPGAYPEGNNSIGFNAFPGGYRNTSGLYSSFGHIGYWWSSTEEYFDGGNHPLSRILRSRASNFKKNMDNKGNGFSVRLIKD